MVIGQGGITKHQASTSLNETGTGSYQIGTGHNLPVRAFGKDIINHQGLNAGSFNIQSSQTHESNCLPEKKLLSMKTMGMPSSAN
jgi:hypothetical protein